jgi:hypothetical protein
MKVNCEGIFFPIVTIRMKLPLLSIHFSRLAEQVQTLENLVHSLQARFLLFRKTIDIHIQGHTQK